MKETRPPLVYRLGVPAVVVAAAMALEGLTPGLPAFVALFPAVVLAAFVGGRLVGLVALAVTAAFALLQLYPRLGAEGSAAAMLGLVLFVAAGFLAIAIVGLRDDDAARLHRERQRLEAALRAANAAVWELSPEGKLYWDKNFYRLVGLDPLTTPPATPSFLAMIHPEDRAAMAEARRLMDSGVTPRAVDEYRLTRPDGTVVWLENHRTRYEDGGAYFIGITQDITRRKLAEERVQSLLHEAAHRSKNQLAVIMSIARETSQSSRGPEEFEEVFGARLRALSRSNDLLMQGLGRSADLNDLLMLHLEPFGAGSRCRVAGEPIAVSPIAAQYLGMAFHELSTNAVKHGSLRNQEGWIEVRWDLVDEGGGRRFVLRWAERGGPPPSEGASGFGTRVLVRLVPAALAGAATRTFPPEGLEWRFEAPLPAISESAAAQNL